MLYGSYSCLFSISRIRSTKGQLIPTSIFAIFLFLALLRGLCRYGEHYFKHYVAFHTLARFRGLVFKKLRRLTPQALDQKDSGHLLKMIGEDIEALEILFAHTLAPICTGILSASLIFISFAYFNLSLAIIALLTYFIVSLVIPYYFETALEHLLEGQTKAHKQYASFFIESLQAMKDLIQFQLVDKRFSRLNQVNQEVNKLERKITQRQYMQFTMTFLILGLDVSLFTVIDFYLVKVQSLQLAEGLLLITAFSTSFALFLELGRLRLGFKRAIHAGRNLFELLEELNRHYQVIKSLRKLIMWRFPIYHSHILTGSKPFIVI